MDEFMLWLSGFAIAAGLVLIGLHAGVIEFVRRGSHHAAVAQSGDVIIYDLSDGSTLMIEIRPGISGAGGIGRKAGE